MFHFFRRYERAFFIVITAMIVISFSFFGTFNAFTSKPVTDSVAFTAVDGSKVMQSEFTDMMTFLGSDLQDQLYSPSQMRGNGLNDGILRKDILETGIGSIILPTLIESDRDFWQTKFEREKRFEPYVHPDAQFVSTVHVWTYFAPDLKNQYDTFKNQKDFSSADAIQARINLYMQERAFPSFYLRQLIGYLQNQYSWLAKDEELDYKDLSLFGYHNVQDWFGKQFLEAVSAFIINTAKIAEQKGYVVTKEEALASLYKQAENGFEQNQQNPNFPIQNVSDYYKEQLLKLGMDQSRAVGIWKEILLFHRYLRDNAQSVLVDSLAWKDFLQYANEYADIEQYLLPKDLCFSSQSQMQQFQIYLQAVSKPGNSLLMPKSILSASDVKKSHPELVQKEFTLRYSVVDKDMLGSRATMKDTWNWQLVDANFKKLQEHFSELKNSKCQTANDREKCLDALEIETRARIDNYSRKCITEEHPEWIVEAFQDVPVKEEKVFIRKSCLLENFPGIDDMQKFLLALESPQNELKNYSQDNRHFYKIEIIERSQSDEIVPFSKAFHDKTLSQLLDKILQESYIRLRSSHPEKFLDEKGEWKPFDGVKEEVSLLYFADLYKTLDKVIEKTKANHPKFTDWTSIDKSRLAVRMLPYMEQVQKEIKQNPELFSTFIQNESEDKNVVASADQWKLVRALHEIVRGNDENVVPYATCETIKEGNWSDLFDSAKQGISFFKVIAKGIQENDEMLREKISEEKQTLAKEALYQLALQVFDEIQMKRAFPFASDNKQTDPKAEKTV